MTETIVLTLEAILASWEDEDKHRYFPLADGHVAIRDGGTGTWRGVVKREDLGDLQ